MFDYPHVSGLQVSPIRATRYVGDSVRLNCSDSLVDSLHWIHHGSQSQTYIYNPGIGVLPFSLTIDKVGDILLNWII